MHPDLFADGSTRDASVDEVLDAALDVFAKIGIRRATVDEIATQNGVDPHLARAIIQAESAFYDKARSRAGAEA